jgi:signal peptidase
MEPITDAAPPRRAVRAVLRWGSRALFAAIVAGILLMVGVLLVVPRVTNGAALTVLTGSMTPDIPVGSVVVIRPVDPGTLRVGDVATYQVSPGKDVYITHRIVKVDDSTTPATFRFKGDANRGPDTDPVPGTAIRGKVWFHVAYLGAVRDSLQGRAGLGLLAMLVLGAYAVAQVVSALRERRQGRTPAVRPETTTIDRTLVLARFGPLADPRDTARELGGVVVESDETGFSLLLAPEPRLLDLLGDVLAMHHPDRVHVLEGPVELTAARAETVAPVPM